MTLDPATPSLADVITSIVTLVNLAILLVHHFTMTKGGGS